VIVDKVSMSVHWQLFRDRREKFIAYTPHTAYPYPVTIGYLIKGTK
jgi:hypothetical protein